MDDVAETQSRWWPLLTAALFAAFAYTLVRTAWMCDDAFITLRTIDNGVSGLGWGFNANERVQVYTHPLWMMILTPFYAVTREPFFTTIFVSMNVALIAAAVLAWGIALTPLRAAAMLLLLVTSKAFMDFSTSGLENPLSHLLVALFFIALLRDKPVIVSLLTSALMLNRLDLALIALPGFAWMFYKGNARGTMVLGLLPIALWLLFALVYYGSPLPNTYYAKMWTGIPKIDLFAQGLYYYLDMLTHDPTTLAVIVVGIATAFFFGNASSRALAVGAVLYALYIIYIGGDFMSGRFFTVPFFCAVCILSKAPIQKKVMPAFAVVAACIGAIGFGPAPFFTGSDYGLADGDPIRDHGIADERRFYYQGCGLLTAGVRAGKPTHAYATEARNLDDERIVGWVTNALGMKGYYVGSQVHVRDTYGLADPFTARMPMFKFDEWRPGHYERPVDDFYGPVTPHGEPAVKAFATPRDILEVIEDYKKVIRGPIWSWERFRIIPNFAFVGPTGYDVDFDEIRERIYDNPDEPRSEYFVWKPIQ